MLLKQKEKEITNLKLKFKNKQISTLEKTNKELINRPTTTNNIVNNDNSKNNYIALVNQHFEKLEILNEDNVNKRINSLTTEEQIKKYDFGNFIPGFENNLIHVLKDLSFCTDKSRKIVVIKDDKLNSVKLSVEEMLERCLLLGREGIKDHINLTEKIVDDKVCGYDYSLTSEMLDAFLEDVAALKSSILDKNKFVNILSDTSPLKNLHSSYIKIINHLTKASKDIINNNTVEALNEPV